jgi:nucleoside-diphosphate-sugar epimerase
LNRILVTGAGGFIGTRLLSRLCSEPVAVRAVVRRSGVESTDGNIEWMQAELAGDKGCLTALCRDCESIVHLAGLAHNPGSNASRYRLHNTEVTRRLAEAAASAGVNHFLFMSTAKVYGEGFKPVNGDQIYNDACRPDPKDEYSASKLKAENALLEIAERTGMRCTILRPPLIYGPGVRANFLRLMRAVEKGTPLPLGSVVNRRSLIHVDNLSDLICRALQATDSGGKVYGVSDLVMSTPELIRSIALALDVRPRLFPFPVKLLELLGRVAGQGRAIERLTRSFVVDDTALRRDLGWQPLITPQEGMRETATWYLRKDH